LPAVDVATLLTVWEEGSSQPPLTRALQLLAAGSGMTQEEWARVPIGERDAGLLRLKEEWFGSRLEASEVCPQCGERLEATFSTLDLQRASPRSTPGPFELNRSGFAVEFRLPTSLDLWESGSSDVPGARETLLRGCITSARRGDEPVDPRTLPEDVLTGVVDQMAEADPMADMHVELSCALCGHSWTVALDITGYLWSEVEDWAKRLLIEIHTLASAYGWGEAEILALSPNRRRSYLDLLGA
jgi:hypothetical protein